jgi:hypothetical protein
MLLAHKKALDRLEVSTCYPLTGTTTETPRPRADRHLKRVDLGRLLEDLMPQRVAGFEGKVSAPP